MQCKCNVCLVCACAIADIHAIVYKQGLQAFCNDELCEALDDWFGAVWTVVEDKLQTQQKEPREKYPHLYRKLGS